MAKKPERLSVISDQPIDPAVASILNTQSQRQADAHLPAKERKRKARERAKAAERAPRRVSWDIREDIKAEVQKQAASKQIPESQLAGLLLWYGLQAWFKGEIILNPYLKTSRSPRYIFTLEIPEKFK